MIMKKITSQVLKEETDKYLKDHKIIRAKSIVRTKTFKKPYTSKLGACPECGSKLIVDVTGMILCSQDRLKEWYNKCLEYERGDEKTKLTIIKEDTQNQFFHLYDRWKQKDAKGNRSLFNCIYTNRLHSPVPNYNWWILDVWQVRRLENILRRRLSQAELDGVVKVKYTNRLGQAIEESIVRYRFPWDLL
jgi:hypothetical protein